MKNAVAVFLAIVFVAACAAVGVWGTERLVALVQPEEESDAEGPEPVRVTVARPEPGEIRDSYGALGTIRAVRSVDLRPLAEGRVEEVAVVSGERVAEDDLILALDDRAETAALEQARATLAEARAAFERYETLASENVAAEARFEEARGAYERARAEVATAEAALEDTRLRAPFDGVVGLVDIDPGERIDPATAVTTLDHIATVEAEFAVPERYYGRVRAGQQVLLEGEVHPGRSFEGEVAVKAPRIAAGSRSFEVRARIDNADHALVPGMFMNATLVFETYEAPMLPEEAIISEGTSTYVYTVEDGTARRTPIEIGTRQEGRTEITGGLEEDARVVTTGYDRLSDGQPVEIAEAETAEVTN